MKILNKAKSLNIFVIIVLFLLGSSFFYFLYNRQRNQINVYALINVSQGTTGTTVPYWLDNAISINDKDINPLGRVNLEVIDKESFESGGSARSSYLLLKVNAIKDRSGTLLFKNKPLLVGSVLDLKLPKAVAQGRVINISDELPVFEYKKVLVSGHDMSIEGETAGNLAIGSQILNNKGEVIAKVQNKQIKRVNPIGLLYDSRSGLFEGTGTTKVDVIVEVEMTVKKINERYFFMEIQKVKPDEFIFLPLKEVSLNLLVTSVKELK